MDAKLDDPFRLIRFSNLDPKVSREREEERPWKRGCHFSWSVETKAIKKLSKTTGAPRVRVNTLTLTLSLGCLCKD